MVTKIEKINPQQAKVNSQVVDHVLKGMEFTSLDDFFIKNYEKSIFWGILFSIIFGGLFLSLVLSALKFQGYFFYGSLAFGLFSSFVLFMFIYKAIMMNLYLKIRKKISNIQEYETFTKILFKNSYQIFSDDDLTEVLDSIEKDNQRALNGEIFSVNNIFKLNGDDKVLIAVSSYRKRKFDGREVL